MVITISNQYGTGALGIARVLAEQLRYTFVDKELPVVVAKRLQSSVEAVEAAEDTSRSMSERLLSGLEMATPEVGAGAEGAMFDEQCFREVQVAVRDYASQGDCILIGRGANLILGRRGDVLRVFMHAPRDWRMHHIMKQVQVDEPSAAAEVDRMDRARARYIKRYYDREWTDLANYDIALDVARFGAQGCVQIIADAVRAHAK
ncbi:MAG: cytidylate kinase-like family protein [Candidatus Eremiobacteraeota bacterium]|nr:cytidylate kinase-like family protein [Candidatus Eremiobacteraeota bacterium]